MTNAIEQAKREMYEHLELLKYAYRNNPKPMLFGFFETSIEAYLDQVRQDHEALHETARKRFEDVQAIEAANDKLSKSLRCANETIQRCAAQSLETIRDLESRLESAINLQKCYERIACDYTEKSADLEKQLSAMTANRDELARNNLAGDKAYREMKQDRDDCQRRMQAIDHAYNEQQKKTGTCGQVCGDRCASEQPDAKTMALLSVIVDCQQLVSDWAVYGYRAKKQMKKMAYVLNNNPELCAALDHFEGKA